MLLLPKEQTICSWSFQIFHNSLINCHILLKFKESTVWFYNFLQNHYFGYELASSCKFFKIWLQMVCLDDWCICLHSIKYLFNFLLCFTFKVSDLHTYIMALRIANINCATTGAMPLNYIRIYIPIWKKFTK